MRIALIPARGGSKRLPSKNILPFCGEPLIAWSILQAKESKCFDRIIVSTEDEEIAGVAREYGSDVIFRPEELAGDDVPTCDVVSHIYDVVDFDSCVILQPTNPLRLPDDIQRFSMAFDECKELVTVYKAEFIRARDYKMLCKPEVLTRNIITGLMYGVKPFVVKKDGVTPNRFYVNNWQANEIDTAEDFKICEAIFRKMIANQS